MSHFGSSLHLFHPNTLSLSLLNHVSLSQAKPMEPPVSSCPLLFVSDGPLGESHSASSYLSVLSHAKLMETPISSSPLLFVSDDPLGGSNLVAKLGWCFAILPYSAAGHFLYSYKPFQLTQTSMLAHFRVAKRVICPVHGSSLYGFSLQPYFSLIWQIVLFIFL